MPVRKEIITVFLLVCICLHTSAEGDSIPSARPMYLSAQFNDGFILPTKKITSGSGYNAPHFSALTLKYGLKAKGNKWQDYAFGMPYGGIGVYLPRYARRKDMGDPFSVFLFQGAAIKAFKPNLSLHYEINLGASFNWNHYDAYTHRGFIVLGSSTNVHLGGNWYFKWKLSNRIDLHAGLSINHFSNGALRTPNNGLNSISPFVEIAYNIREEKKRNIDRATYQPPAFEKRTAHDFTVMFTTRTLKVDTTAANLISKYPDRRFNVVGLNYSYMFQTARRFMFGPSIETVYDESVNASFRGERNPHTGEYREYYEPGKTSDRFSVGLSAKGEVTMPGYSIFANFGCDIYHKDKRESRFYQIYGLKVYLFDNLFATFGVRSTNVTRSQYLYLNIGYTFNRFRK